MITQEEVWVKRHFVDGFTLYAISDDHLVHRRYIDYTLEEAMTMFLEEVNG